MLITRKIEEKGIWKSGFSFRPLAECPLKSWILLSKNMSSSLLVDLLIATALVTYLRIFSYTIFTRKEKQPFISAFHLRKKTQGTEFQRHFLGSLMTFWNLLHIYPDSKELPYKHLYILFLLNWWWNHKTLSTIN